MAAIWLRLLVGIACTRLGGVVGDWESVVGDWESVVGDPGMQAELPRLMVESWSFCNRACVSGDRSCAVAPRFADCAAASGPGPRGNRVTAADEAAGVSGGGESFDEAAVRKEAALGALCAEPFPRAWLGASSFWTAMLKSGNAIDVAACGLGGGQCRSYYARGTAPLGPVAEVDAVARALAHEACIHEGGDASACAARAAAPLPPPRAPVGRDADAALAATAIDPAACARAHRPWWANRLPVNQPLLEHDWSSRPAAAGGAAAGAAAGAAGGAAGVSGGYKATYGNGSLASVRWARGDGLAGGPLGLVFRCALRTSALYPWLMLYLGADAARGLKGGAAYDGRGMLAARPSERALSVLVAEGGLPAYVPLRVSFALRLVSLGRERAGACFYALNLGACWRLDGGGCDGDTRRDVTRYVLLDTSGPLLCSAAAPHNCPRAHRFANGSVALRSDWASFPYKAYAYYCGPSTNGGCDGYSNPNAQEIVKLAPHAEWAPLGLPAAPLAADGVWRRSSIAAGLLGARLVFAGAPPARPVWWRTLNVGAEAGIPGVSTGEGHVELEWELGEMDVRLPARLLDQMEAADTEPAGAAPPAAGAAPPPADAAAPADAAPAAAAPARAAAAASPSRQRLSVGGKAVSRTSARFVCVTLDWWPSNKCDYGRCQWAHASVLTAPLADARLAAALRFLAPLTVRVGGTAQDNITYAGFGDDRDDADDCPPFAPPPPARASDFGGGCLRRARWDELLDLCAATGARLVWSVNAVVGRGNRSLAADVWDSTQARRLLAHAAARPGGSAALWGVEYGNEPGHAPPSSYVFCEPNAERRAHEAGGGACGWQDADAAAAVQAAGLLALDKAVTDAFGPRGDAPARRPRPLVLGPAWAGFRPDAFSGRYLELSAGALDILTYHEYPLGPAYGRPGGDDALLAAMLAYDGTAAEETLRAAVDAARGAAARARLRARARVWIGESGGAYNSGHARLSAAFANGFWYARYLAHAARGGADAVCRQSLLGGGYALLEPGSLRPRPDFYVAALFGRLMGAAVLPAAVLPAALGPAPAAAAAGAPAVAAFAHCARACVGPDDVCAAGAVSVLVVNPTERAAQLDLALGDDGGALAAAAPRLEYRLSARELSGRLVDLNGAPLEPTGEANTTLPALEPRLVRGGPADALVVDAYTINFFVLPARARSECSPRPAVAPSG